MKILLLSENLGSGGMQRRLIELIKGLGTYSDVDLRLVVFSDNIHYREIYDLGIPITILRRVPKKNPIVFYRLFQLCKDWMPDLIHSWGSMPPILAIPSSILLRIKIINGNVVDAPKNMGFFDKRLFRARLTYPFSERVVGNSLAGLREYKVPKKKAVCIYNGFDNQRIMNLKTKSLIRKEFNITTKKVIGMVGGFFDRKDYATYLNAALIVLEQSKDVTFVALGDGPDLGKSKQMIPADLAPYFIFTGIQKDVESIINVFDIGVLATNTQRHGEGISNAILEYMALEKPVVATFGGGTNEIVVQRKTGILVPPDSPKKMAKQLIYLLNNPQEAKTMGLEGGARVGNSFSLRKMTHAYYNLYQKLLK